MTSDDKNDKSEKRDKSTNRTAFYGFILWLLAIVIMYAGYRLSVERFLDQDWLSRAGCLIVMLGIWSGLGGVIESKLQYRTHTLKKKLAERRVRQAFGADDELLEKEMNKVQQHYNEQLAGLQNKLGVSIGVIEASLLIIGTLLWGFGDLIKYL